MAKEMTTAGPAVSFASTPVSVKMPVPITTPMPNADQVPGAQVLPQPADPAVVALAAGVRADLLHGLRPEQVHRAER